MLLSVINLFFFVKMATQISNLQVFNDGDFDDIQSHNILTDNLVVNNPVKTLTVTDLTVLHNSTIDNNEHVLGNLQVDHNATVNQLTHTGSLQVDTTASVGTNLTVTDLTHTGSLQVDTTASVGTDLHVLHNLQVDNNATVTGTLTANTAQFVNKQVTGTETDANLVVQTSCLMGNWQVPMVGTTPLGGVLTIQSGGVNFVQRSLIYCTKSTTEVANIGPGDHIQYNGVGFQKGTNMTLDTSSPYSNANGTASIGRVTLAAGKVYQLWIYPSEYEEPTANPPALRPELVFRLYNSDTGTLLNGPVSGGGADNPKRQLMDISLTETGGRVEGRIVYANAPLLSLGGCTFQGIEITDS
jgi:hypothetical protein